MDARKKLLGFLDEKVFQPALKTNPSRDSTPGERKLLASVQKRVRGTQIRYYERYSTAAEVKDRFLEDLQSKFGQDLAADMWQLHMTRFEDMVDEFKALCDSLGV